MGILLGVLLIIAGIATIVFGIIKQEQVGLVLSIIIAVMLFIIGALYLVAGCMVPLSNFFTALFLYGAIAIAIGVILLVNTNIVPLVMVYTLSIILLALGVVYIARGIIGIVYQSKTSWIAFCFIIAFFGIVLGVLSLIFKNNVLMIIYIVVGAILAAVGVGQIVVIVKK